MTNRRQGGTGNLANDRDPADRDRASRDPGSRDPGSKAGRRGAEEPQQHQQDHGSGQLGGSGTFADDRERAAEGGRKGGQSAPDEKRSSSQNHERASDAGRKGGER